jgi:hypothetical protein
MIAWLYKYIFRSIGIALLIGMLTVLYLKFNWVIHHGLPPARAASAPNTGGQR